MNHLEAAHTLAMRHHLDSDQREQLLAMAAPSFAAQSVGIWFWRGVAILAAVLGGLGLIMWVAANWETFGRFGRFALLQAVLIVMSLGAAWKLGMSNSAARESSRFSLHDSSKVDAPTSSVAWAMGIAAFLSIGALFAYFGQTYQTGADPWQLFALWAVLAIPLCLALRGDMLWMPWVIVSATAVALWLNAHTQHSWRMQVNDFGIYLCACLMGAIVAFSVSPLLKRWTGAGLWSMRTAVTLNVLGLVIGGVAGLFSASLAPQYLLALVVAGVGCAALARPQLFDVYSLSIFALGLIVLLISGLLRLLTSGSSSDWFGVLFLLAISAAGMLAAAVRLILDLQKKSRSEPEMARPVTQESAK